MNTYRLILADDHALFREGLKKVLEEDHDLRIIGEANDGRELLEILKHLVPDLILLDISMPNLRGIDVVSEIKKSFPAIKIMILTMFDDPEFVYQSIALGADGYFLKKDAGTLLLSAIDKIRQGKTYVSPCFTDILTIDWDEVRRGIQKPVLTPRERQILKLIAEGKTTQEIADALFISVFTVKRHRANMAEKLNLKNVADLVKYAIQNAYI